LDEMIVAVVRPIVRVIVRATFRTSAGPSPAIDADDVEQTVLTSVTAAVMRLRSPDPPAQIRSLPDYAAVVAYNTCNAVLRQRAPARARLRAHVRYVLTHHADLTLVPAAGHRWLAARRSWADTRPPAAADAVGAALARVAMPAGRPYPGGPALAQFIAAALDAIGGPCFIEDLVAHLAAAFGIADAERDQDQEAEPEANTPSPVDVLDHRERLARLWREVCALPPRQRNALLLNLRDEDGGGAIELFPATNVASMRDIADALEMSEVELAGLWTTLPKDDEWIAARLGLTRRQVINLRKCARERLFRRSRASNSRTPARPRSVPMESAPMREAGARIGRGEPEV
jgi:hypothetical protein